MNTNQKLNKRKFIFLLMTSGLGGAERQALYYSEHLIKNHDCTVEWWSTLKFNQDLSDLLSGLGIKTQHIRFPGSKNTIKFKIKLFLLTRLFKKAKVDIIFPYLIVPNVYANLIWKRTGAKACFWNQRDEGILKFDYDKSIIHTALERSCCLIANSEGGKNYLLKQGAEPNKIHVIKNGINIYMPDESTRAPIPQVSKYDYICTMIANIHPNKDHITLIRAWKQVVVEFQKKNKYPLLILLGKQFEHYNEVYNEMKRLGINEHVLIPGFSKDIFSYLENSNLYVHSSLSEGTSNSILEAMMAERAVVATAIPSIINTVASENIPYLSPPKDANTMAENIIKLLENPELRSSIGKLNRIKAIEEYSMESMCKQTDKLISQYLD